VTDGRLKEASVPPPLVEVEELNVNSYILKYAT